MSSSAAHNPAKTIAFIGATGGCGLAGLRHALAAGHQCIALCRTPAKLAAVFPPETTPNLTLVQGNAHDETSVAKTLVVPGSATSGSPAGTLVDLVVSTLGGKLDLVRMTLDDPDVCKKAMVTLLAALATLRAQGAVPGRSQSGLGQGKGPKIVTISTTGISAFKRDVPLLQLPMYHIMLSQPHADKKVMEEHLLASGEAFTIVRPAFLGEGERRDKTVRVGVEDPVKGIESSAVGYGITREDTGRWIFENLVQPGAEAYLGKIVMITQ